MTRIALLDDRIPAQIDENPSDFEGLEVVWSGTDLAELERQAPKLRPTVLVVSQDLLPQGDPADVHARLLESTRAELLVSLYTFARRKDLTRLTSERCRPVKAPVSLRQLRTQMMSVLIRDLLGASARDSSSSATVSPSSSREAPASALRGAATARPQDTTLFGSRRFSDRQLARLMEIESVVDCECPNHLGELVMSLTAFERYAAQCQSKNDKDAQIHAMLHRETRRARAIMEAALADLVAHEGIQL